MYIYKLLHNKNPTNESSQHSFHLGHERGHWVHYALTSFFKKRKKERLIKRLVVYGKRKGLSLLNCCLAINYVTIKNKTTMLGCGYKQQT